jgi:hypothetical protein
MTKKLGIIVPYRNRYEHLQLFKNYIQNYLNDKNIVYELIIVEQDNARLFNRGMLLNIGFIEAKKLKCDYVVFHDVDMLPNEVDYSYSDVPLHLSTDFLLENDEKPRTIFDEYFGGVTLFPINYFEEIDGYSNKYWGWGYEDNDLLLRCKEKFIPLDTLNLKNIKNKTKALKLNGTNAYVKVKNVIDFRTSFTLFLSFFPDRLYLNPEKESDEFTAFSIPGYDFAISYTSFLRYNFCMFDSEFNPFYVNSNIKTNYKTNMVIVFDAIDNLVKVYQDGIFIGQTNNFKKLFKYSNKPYFYLGVGDPEREVISNYFKGYIDSFCYYDKILLDDEILEISQNEENLLNKNFGNYKSSSSLKIYYDANYIRYYKLYDLSENENHGEIINCEITNLEIDTHTKVQIPFRRKSKFVSLKHDENGFDGQKWKDKNTRWNQLRYQNEVLNHISLINRDGLSTLEYKVYGKVKEKNITQITVGI